jgi:hypothetical protein
MRFIIFIHLLSPKLYSGRITITTKESDSMAITFRTGNEADLDKSQLVAAEGAYTADTHKLFIGNGDGTAIQTGDMFKTDFSAGTGAANVNAVDHAMYADNAGIGGWIALIGSLVYSSADSPTFSVATSSDLTGVLSVGMKVKLTQTAVKYFIITAITSTSITLYGGTDYTLTNAIISGVYYSLLKAPFGFPLNPAKWTVSSIMTSAATVGSPTGNTWYTAFSIFAPIGAWKAKYDVAAITEASSASTLNMSVALSTSQTAPNDTSFDTGFAAQNLLSMQVQLAKTNKRINVSAKTVYYLIMSTPYGGNLIQLSGQFFPTTIELECAYL